MLRRSTLLLAFGLALLTAVLRPALAAARATASDPYVLGFVTALTDDSITIAEQTLALTPDTDLQGEIAVGSFASAILQALTDPPTALLVRDVADPVDGLVRFSAQISAVTADIVTVAGVPVRLTPETEVTGALVVGRVANVVAEVGDFELIARAVSAPAFEGVAGFVTAFDDNSVTLNGTQIFLTDETFVLGTPVLDALFAAIVQIESDGTATALFLLELAQPDELGLSLFVGTVTALSDASISVDDMPFALTGDSYVAPDVALDANVSVIAYAAEDGTYQALVVRRLYGSDNTQRSVGRVTALTDDAVWVDGQRLALGPATQFDAPLSIGARIHIVAQPRAAGDPLALRVRHLPAQPVVGMVTGLRADGLRIDGVAYGVNADTLMAQTVAVGDRVAVSAAAGQALMLSQAPAAPTAVALAGQAIEPGQAALWLPLLMAALAWVSWRLVRRAGRA